MWWATEVPLWFTRLTAALTASVTAAAGALAVFSLLVYVEAEGRLLVASIVHPEAVAAGAIGCGVVAGLATASGRTQRAMLRRFAATAGVLALLGVAGVGGLLLWADASERDFSADRFRAAVEAEDLDALETEARRAVASRALIGMSAAEARRTLGRPDRLGRRRHLWIWDLGMINDFFGPGDGGALYVQFDDSWRRVRSATVATGFGAMD